MFCRCRSQCVDTVLQVPPDYLIVVGKKIAEEQISRSKLDMLAAEGREFFHSKAKDEVRLPNTDTWQVATETIKKELDKIIPEKSELKIYLNSVMQLTTNKVNTYSQGQLVLIQTITPVSDDPNSAVITGKLLPPGNRLVQVDRPDPSWTNITLKSIKTREQQVGKKFKIYARRTQFNLRYYFSSTVHRVIGDTLQKLATCISKRDKIYSLWLRSQLQVIISRVTDLGNIIFVGKWDDVEGAILSLLKETSSSIKHIDDKIIKLNALNNQHVILEPYKGILPLRASIPADNYGYIYFVISALHPEVNSIHLVEDINAHLDDINSGADLAIESSFMPYLPGFFITGFDGEQLTRNNFSDRYRMRIFLEHLLRFCSERINITWESVIAIVKYAVPRYQLSNKLTFVQLVAVSEEVSMTVEALLSQHSDNHAEFVSGIDEFMARDQEQEHNFSGFETGK